MGTTPLRRNSSRRCASDPACTGHRLGDGRESQPEHPPALRPPLLRCQGRLYLLRSPGGYYPRTSSGGAPGGVGPEAIEGAARGLLVGGGRGSGIPFSGEKPIEGLGSIGNGREGLQGFL